MPDAIADAVVAKLSTHLGPHVAKMTLKSFARKIGVEQLTPAHLPRLIEEIRPMLNVMIGRGPSEAVVAELARVAGP